MTKHSKTLRQSLAQYLRSLVTGPQVPAPSGHMASSQRLSDAELDSLTAWLNARD